MRDSYEPVPFAISSIRAAHKAASENITSENANNSKEQHKQTTERWDTVINFSETAAARGVLGRFSGSSVMGIIKNFMQL